MFNTCIMIPPTLLYLHKIALDILNLVSFHTNFEIVFSSFVKNVTDTLMKTNYTEFAIALSRMDILAKVLYSPNL